MDRHGPGAAAERCDLGSQNNSIVTRRNGRSNAARTDRHGPGRGAANGSARARGGGGAPGALRLGFTKQQYCNTA